MAISLPVIFFLRFGLFVLIVFPAHFLKDLKTHIRLDHVGMAVAVEVKHPAEKAVVAENHILSLLLN